MRYPPGAGFMHSRSPATCLSRWVTTPCFANVPTLRRYHGRKLSRDDLDEDDVVMITHVPRRTAITLRDVTHETACRRSVLLGRDSSVRDSTPHAWLVLSRWRNGRGRWLAPWRRSARVGAAPFAVLSRGRACVAQPLSRDGSEAAALMVASSGCDASSCTKRVRRFGPSLRIQAARRCAVAMPLEPPSLGEVSGVSLGRPEAGASAGAGVAIGAGGGLGEAASAASTHWCRLSNGGRSLPCTKRVVYVSRSRAPKLTT